MAVVYPGLNPANVSREAKYSVIRTQQNEMAVRLIYRLSSSEKELLTTTSHSNLVEMVNSVKMEINGQIGGVFYINEYGHVLVPAYRGEPCYFAGTYNEVLEFDLEGDLISAKAPKSLSPGGTWYGPHVGIPYTLKAGARDISYKKKVTPTRVKEFLLSEYVGSIKAEALARRLGEHKGSSGGAIYINEAQEFFAPVQTGEDWTYTYLGGIDYDSWFPSPLETDED